MNKSSLEEHPLFRAVGGGMPIEVMPDGTAWLLAPTDYLIRLREERGKPDPRSRTRPRT